MRSQCAIVTANLMRKFFLPTPGLALRPVVTTTQEVMTGLTLLPKIMLTTIECLKRPNALATLSSPDLPSLRTLSQATRFAVVEVVTPSKKLRAPTLKTSALMELSLAQFTPTLKILFATHQVRSERNAQL